MRWIASLIALLSAAGPAWASDPNPDDAARAGQLAPDPDAPRDWVLDAHREAAESCWERANRRRGAERTRVTVTFRVAASGAIRGARIVEPARPAAAARRCVLAALRARRFAADEVLRVLGDQPETREVRHSFVLNRIRPAQSERAARASVLRILGALDSGDTDGRIVDVLTGGSATGPGVVGGIGGLGGVGTIGTGGGIGGLGLRGVGQGGSAANQTGSPRGSITLAEPTIRGSLSRQAASASLRGALPGVRACYRRALARDPSVSGRLSARVLVEAGGHVATATLGADGPADAALRSCVTARLQRATFPALPGGGVAIVDVQMTLAP